MCGRQDKGCAYRACYLSLNRRRFRAALEGGLLALVMTHIMMGPLLSERKNPVSSSEGWARSVKASDYPIILSELNATEMHSLS